MVSESSNESAAAGEVRLIDMVATVIRYRRVALGTFGVVTLAGLVLLFVAPLWGFNLTGASSGSVVATVRTVQVPPDAQSLYPVDYPGLVMAETQNLGMVREVYQTSLMDAKESNLKAADLNLIIRRLLDKRLLVAVRGNMVTLTLKVEEEKQTQAKAFLSSLMAKLKANITKISLPNLLAAIANLQIDAQKDAGELTLEKQVDLQVRLRVLQSLAANPDYPLVIVGVPEVIAGEAGPSKGLALVLLVLVALVMALIAALGNGAISKTRANVQDMELLRQAWNKKL